jgi:N-glycosylase/DNA lyase
MAEKAAVKEVILEYQRLAAQFLARRVWNDMPEDELWRELCLCILSSNVPFELAKSAMLHLWETGLLRPTRVMRPDDQEKEITRELSKAIYLPTKKDGSCRRYRFPNMRGRDIVAAARALYDNGPGLKTLLSDAESEIELRRYLAENVPGVGLKEASHFLRNIGYANSLAIIDRHIVDFLSDVLDLPPQDFEHITPSKYLTLETYLKELCQQLGLELPLFDWAIWNHVRSR